MQDAVLTVSDQERLQQMDFEAMSAEDIDAAKREIRRLTLPLGICAAPAGCAPTRTDR